MIRKSIVAISILLLMVVHVGYSQSIKDNSSINANNQDYLFIQNFQTPSTIITNTNNVLINQIGSDNEVKVKTQSLNNDIVLSQNGTQNKIILDVAADNIKETISQIGNYNYVLDYSSFGAENHSLEVLQTGNNQNLTWFGDNALSESLKVTMQGESKTIIVRNFN
tara:strand:+ start:23079 stop:23576 length:498 start_codon:yes stop_codon:yes gene_type:complete